MLAADTAQPPSLDCSAGSTGGEYIRISTPRIRPSSSPLRRAPPEVPWCTTQSWEISFPSGIPLRSGNAGLPSSYKVALWCSRRSLLLFLAMMLCSPVVTALHPEGRARQCKQWPNRSGLRSSLLGLAGTCTAKGRMLLGLCTAKQPCARGIRLFHSQPKYVSTRPAKGGPLACRKDSVRQLGIGWVQSQHRCRTGPYRRFFP